MESSKETKSKPISQPKIPVSQAGNLVPTGDQGILPIRIQELLLYMVFTERETKIEALKQQQANLATQLRELNEQIESLKNLKDQL